MAYVHDGKQRDGFTLTYIHVLCGVLCAVHFDNIDW